MKQETTKSIHRQSWGKDHWGLLLYIETVVVDHSGKLDLKKMRVNETKRSYGNGNPFGWLDDFGTVISDGTTYPSHDDIDVLDELILEGLVIKKGTSETPVIGLTDLGWDIAHEIRRYYCSIGKPISNYKI